MEILAVCHKNPATKPEEYSENSVVLLLTILVLIAMGCQWDFPYGGEQWLRFQNLELHLEEHNFVATEGLRFGYDRTIDPESAVVFSRSITGCSVFSGSYYGLRYKFKWDLRLDAIKAGIFRSILLRQDRAISNHRLSDVVAPFGATLPEVAVELVDKRLGVIEPLPRTRAKSGNVVGVGSSPWIASNTDIGYWGKYWVMLDLKGEFAVNLLGYNPGAVLSGTIEGYEIAPTTTANDD